MAITLVTYNNSKIEPAPLIDINKTPIRASNGEKIGVVYRITLSNQSLAYMGSPKSDGSFDGDFSNQAPTEVVSSDARLAAISRKIEALKKLFSVDGAKLAWKSANGAQETYCYPRVVSVNFSKGIWFSTVDYTIELEADIIYGLGTLDDERFANLIKDSQESWSINPNDIINEFSVQHSVNAVGIPVYNTGGVVLTGAWQIAKAYANSRIGYDNLIVSGSYLRGNFDFGNNFSAYNYSVVENIDEVGGSYGLTESWILFSGIYRDNWTASFTESAEDSQRTKTLSIRGIVQGYYIGQNNRQQAYGNAASGWLVIQSGLYARASGFITNPVFSTRSIDHDFQNGSISYSYDYDNKNLTSGTFEEYTINRQWGYEDYRTTVEINGTIQGFLGPGEPIDIKYTRALSQWSYVQSILFNRVYLTSSGIIAGLQSAPISKSINANPIAGNIQYTYTYNNRYIQNYEDNYTVDYNYSRDNGVITVSVNGTVQGYDVIGTGNIGERYSNALAGLPTDATIYSRATTYGNASVVNSPTNKQITRQINAGAIQYNYTYTSEPTGCFPGVLSQYIVVTEQKPGRVVAQVDVLGRLQGPILQDIASNTARVRKIDIEMALAPPTSICDLAVAYGNKPYTDTLVSGLKPTATYAYLVEDSETFDLNRGRYSRSSAWLYEV